MVSWGVKNRATDIHFERLDASNTRVRYRIDGRLMVKDSTMNPKFLSELVGSIKHRAEMLKGYDPWKAQDVAELFAVDPEMVDRLGFTTSPNRTYSRQHYVFPFYDLVAERAVDIIYQRHL
jgi:hypothetical protein